MILERHFILGLITVMTSLSGISCNHTHHLDDEGNVTALCSQSTSTRHILLTLFSISVFLVGVFGNIFTIIIIQSSRGLRSQGAYLFVTSLAVADLGVSLFVTTVKIDMYLENGSFCHGFELCVFLLITDFLFPTSSITHLVVIAIDRWYAIACPFTYVANMTSKRARYGIALLWIYSIVWTLLGLFIWDEKLSFAYDITIRGIERYCFSINRAYHTTAMILIYILPITLTTCLYMVVLYIASKQALAISKYNVTKRRLKARQLRIETKAAKTVAIVFLAYIVCWLPHFVIVFLTYWKYDTLQNFHDTNATLYDVVTTIISNILPTLNSCINPFIYFVFSAQFRVAYKDFQRKVLNIKHDLIGEPHGPATRSNSVMTTDTRLNSLADLYFRNNSIGKDNMSSSNHHNNHNNNNHNNHNNNSCNQTYGISLL